MSFDWITFLSRHDIDYRDTGHNVSAGNVVVHCPFCGPADQGEHMTISLHDKGWRCWRQPDHHGKNPRRLVQALLGCSFEQAHQIVFGTIFIPTDLKAQVTRRLNPPPVTTIPRTLCLPDEVKPFAGLPSARPYLNYLSGRGFTPAHISALIRTFKIGYCTRGPYQGRVIVPVYHARKLITWTGRTIGRGELRYKTLSADPDKAKKERLPPAVAPIAHHLLDFDRLMKIDADTIYLCEGPFDAMRVNVLGNDHGICATCFFTMTPTDQQVDLLHELLPRFKTRALLLDQGTFATSLRIRSNLAGLGVSIARLPPGIKDPGKLVQKQLFEINP